VVHVHIALTAIDAGQGLDSHPIWVSTDQRAFLYRRVPWQQPRPDLGQDVCKSIGRANVDCPLSPAGRHQVPVHWIDLCVIRQHPDTQLVAEGLGKDGLAENPRPHMAISTGATARPPPQVMAAQRAELGPVLYGLD